MLPCVLFSYEVLSVIMSIQVNFLVSYVLLQTSYLGLPIAEMKA